MNLRRTVSHVLLAVQMTSATETGQARTGALALPGGTLGGSRARMRCGKCSLRGCSGCFNGLLPVTARTLLPEPKVCVGRTVLLPYSILEDFT